MYERGRERERERENKNRANFRELWKILSKSFVCRQGLSVWENCIVDKKIIQVKEETRW